jgi:Tfp pilus assembly protein PilF
MGRLEMLKEHLAEFPSDDFARYGLAMEYANAGDNDAAVKEFATLLKMNPDYTAGYFMAAQTLAKIGKVEAAREMLTNGISSAKRTSNAHAQSEMEGMLGELS